MIKRLDFIVYLRCLAVLLVVAGHGLCIYSNQWAWHVQPINNPIWNYAVRVIYMIHMPTFSIISGYIYIYKKARRL